MAIHHSLNNDQSLLCYFTINDCSPQTDKCADVERYKAANLSSIRHHHLRDLSPPNADAAANANDDDTGFTMMMVMMMICVLINYLSLSLYLCVCPCDSITVV